MLPASRPPASGFAAVLRAATAWLGLTGVALAATGPVVQHGPFEIRSVGQRVSAGGFPNTSGNPFTTREVTTFTVRWRGREVELARGAKSFYYVGRLVDAPQPALLVATTILTLVTEDGDRLRVESFGDPNSPSERSQWLDGAAGQPGPHREFGLGPVPLEDDGRLAGGRWLLIGHHTVLDVQTLRAHAVQPWVASGNGARLAGASASNETARALSPGHRRSSASLT